MICSKLSLMCPPPSPPKYQKQSHPTSTIPMFASECLRKTNYSCKNSAWSYTANSELIVADPPSDPSLSTPTYRHERNSWEKILYPIRDTNSHWLRQEVHFVTSRWCRWTVGQGRGAHSCIYVPPNRNLRKEFVLRNQSFLPVHCVLIIILCLCAL